MGEHLKVILELGLMTKRAKDSRRKGYCSLGFKIHEAMIRPLYDYIAPWTQQYLFSSFKKM